MKSNCISGIHVQTKWCARVSSCFRFWSRSDLKQWSLTRFQPRQQEIWLARGILWVSDTAANKSPGFISEERRFSLSPSRLKGALWGRIVFSPVTIVVSLYIYSHIYSFNVLPEYILSCQGDVRTKWKITPTLQRRIQCSVLVWHFNLLWQSVIMWSAATADINGLEHVQSQVVWNKNVSRGWCQRKLKEWKVDT